MATKKIFAAFAIFSTVVVLLLCLGVSHGAEKTYEVQTYGLPEYRTDTARAIDAYQQMINRLLDSNERNAAIAQAQMNEIIRRLDKIQNDVDNVSRRIANIEKKMGIEQPEDVLKTEAEAAQQADYEKKPTPVADFDQE